MLCNLIRSSSRIQENRRPAADKLCRFPGNHLLLGMVADAFYRVVYLCLIDSTAMAPLNQPILLKFLQVSPDRHGADIQLPRQFVHLYAAVILYHP